MTFSIPGEKRQHKILVIEDDLETLSLFQEILARQFEVLGAPDGGNGMARAITERPDVILLDLFLPGLSGIEVCKELRSNENTRMIPIIVVTGAASDEAREHARLAGADDFMLKPFHAEHLIARILSHIRRTVLAHG